MSNEFKGPVTGNSIQIKTVEGNLVLNGASAATEEEAPSEPVRPADMPKLKAGWVFAGVLFVVIIVIANACGADPEKVVFPSSDQGTRPVGVSDDAVAEVVVDKLALCAKAVVIAPVNCPQTHQVNSPSNVRWELVGDPRDGMQVRWNNDRFLVRGAAAMIISFDTRPQPKVEIERFHFETEVWWRGDDTRIDAIRRPKSDPEAGAVKKDRFTLPDEDIIKAVRDGFTACTSAVLSKTPPTCPRNTSTPVESIRSLDGDPVGDWTINKDDAEYGLLRLTASYSLVHRWTSTFIGIKDSHTRSQYGTYEATVIRTPNKTARLLTIEHVSW